MKPLLLSLVGLIFGPFSLLHPLMMIDTSADKSSLNRVFLILYLIRLISLDELAQNE